MENWWENDEVVSSSPPSSAKSDKWWEQDEAVQKQAPPSKTDTNPLKGLAYGAEGVLRGAQSTTDELKGLLGMARGRSMATALADKLHSAAGLDNYAPAGEALMDNSKGLGERLTYAPRAMVEAAPSLLTQMAPGKLGSAMALANSAYQTAGNNLRTADESGASRSAALAATAMDSVLNRFGIDQALGKSAAKFGLDPAKKLLTGVGAAAGQNVAQTAIDRNLIENKPFTGNDAIVSGVMGGVPAAAFKAARGDITDAGEAARFRQFERYTPEALAGAAAFLKKNSGDYGSIPESKAQDILDRSIKSSQRTLAHEGRDRYNTGPNRVASYLDQQFRANDDTAPNEAFQSAEAAVSGGEPVPVGDIDTLRGALGGTGVGDRWVNALEVSSALGQLNNTGAKLNADARGGGLHATKPAQTLKRVADYFTAGTAGMTLAETLMHGAAKHTIGLPISLGANAIYGGLRGIDRLTGYSNPVERFARRFSDEGQTIAVPPMARAVTEAPEEAPTPPPAPQGPFPANTTDPRLMELRQQFGFDPRQAPDPRELALTEKLMQRAAAEGRVPDMGPRPGENIFREPTEADLVGNARSPRVFRQDSPNVEGYVSPKYDKVFAQRQADREQVPVPPELQAKVEGIKARIAQRKAFRDKLSASNEAEKPVEAPKRKTRLRAPEAAQEQSSAFSVAFNEAPQEAPPPPPKERPMFTTNVFGRDVSIPLDEIRRTPQAWERGVLRDATIRREPIDQMKAVLPKDLHGNVEDLFTAWLAPGTKMDSAYFALEELVNDPRVPDELKGQLLDMWANNPTLNDPTHWE